MVSKCLDRSNLRQIMKVIENFMQCFKIWLRDKKKYQFFRKTELSVRDFLKIQEHLFHNQICHFHSCLKVSFEILHVEKFYKKSVHFFFFFYLKAK